MLNTSYHITRQRILIAFSVFLLLLGLPLIADAQADEPALYDGIDGFIYVIATSMGGAVMLLGGWLLDQSVSMLVIGMGQFLATGIGVAIDSLWVVIRDTFNILFIFGLIYIGFRTILRSGDSDTKRSLILLIVAALLINFSLFITKAIVDFTNVASYQIATAMLGDTAPAAGGEVEPGTGNASQAGGVTQPFMTLLKITTFADSVHISEYEESAKFGRIAVFGLVMMFVMIIAGMVFAAGAFLMISRFIGLIIFMILSPAMFLGFIFPLFAKYQKEWWDKFLRYAFVAPAYLFMLYLSLVVISKLALDSSFNRAWEAESFVDGTAVIFLNFFVIVGFLIASVIVAKQMGVYGAAGSVSLMQKSGNYLRTRAQSYAGRNTIAPLARWAGKGYEKFDAAASKTGKRRFGRFAANAALNVGTLGAWGAIANDRNIRGATDSLTKSKFGGAYSHQDDLDYSRERKQRQTGILAQQERENNIKKGKKAAEKAAKSGTAPNPEVMSDFTKAMKSMTDKQLTEDMNLNLLSNKHVAVHLTNKHLETLEKSGKYSDAQVQQIKDKRKAGFIDIAKQNTAPGTAFNAERNREWLAQKGVDEMSKMPEEVFTEPGMAPHITPAAVEAKIKDGSLLKDLPKVRANIDNQIARDKSSSSSGQGGAYTKQWRSWVERNPHGPRLGLQNV